MEPKHKAVVLVSGGLDSTVLLYDVVNKYGAANVTALNVFYRQRHEVEISRAKYHTTQLGVKFVRINMDTIFGTFSGSALLDDKIDVPHIKDVLGHPQPITYVPFRNMIFLSVALGFAESIDAHAVYYGAQLHDEYGYFDTTEEFISRINQVAQLNRLHQISIEAPLAKNKKSDNIRMGQALGVDFSKTWSCYDPTKRSDTYYACGTCPTCSERITGFKELGLTDPVPYIKTSEKTCAE